MGDSHKSPGHIVDPGKEARSASGIPIVPVFDGYRAFAILGVVLLHLLKASGAVDTGDSDLLARLTWATVGHAIEVLFIVSGFVVFLPTVARGGRFGSLKGYAIRRFARLYPAYWVTLVLMLILLWSTDVTGIATPTFRDAIINFTGLHIPLGMPIKDISTGFALNPVTWTLSVEICFYIVLPLVAAIYFRRPWIGLLAAALITVAWNGLFQNLGQVSENLGLGLYGEEILRLAVKSTLQLPSWAFPFGLGMTGAWCYVNRERIAARFGGRFPRWIFVVSVISFVFFAWQAGLRSGDGSFELVAQTTRFTPWLALGFSASLAAVMISIAIRPGTFGRVFTNSPVRWLGDISYGIFLSHMVIIVLAAKVLELEHDGSLGNFLIWSLVVVPPSILYGYLSARFVEQPFRRWARKYGRRDEG